MAKEPRTRSRAALARVARLADSVQAAPMAEAVVAVHHEARGADQAEDQEVLADRAARLRWK